MLKILSIVDDKKCYEGVRELRWPNGVTCPHCASSAIPAERCFGWYLPPNVQYGKLRDADILGLVSCASKYELEMSVCAKKIWDTRLRLRGVQWFFFNKNQVEGFPVKDPNILKQCAHVFPQTAVGACKLLATLE